MARIATATSAAEVLLCFFKNNLRRSKTSLQGLDMPLTLLTSSPTPSRIFAHNAAATAAADHRRAGVTVCHSSDDELYRAVIN